MRDLWHFHFYGETPLALVKVRISSALRTCRRHCGKRSPAQPTGSEILFVFDAVAASLKERASGVDVAMGHAPRIVSKEVPALVVHEA
jgi:hypothetical protein